MSVIFHLEVKGGKMSNGVRVVLSIVQCLEKKQCSDYNTLMLKHSKSLNSIHKKNIYSVSKVSLPVKVQ